MLRYEISGDMGRFLYRDRIYPFFMMALSTCIALSIALLYGVPLMLQGRGFEASHGFELFDVNSEDDEPVYSFEVVVGPTV